jgi:thioredoxin reductase (NADPH)
MEHIKCLIVGSGPAGYTAAIYASRAGLNPIMYQGLQPGGQLTITTEVDNFPGYPNGTHGPQMMEDLKAQAERFGTEVRFGLVTKVDFSSRPFKWLGLESEQRLNGFGVSACAVCDGFFFKNQEVAIVGAGDTACEEATYLAKICKKVTMLVRKDQFRASKPLQDRVLKTPNIEVLFNSETLEVLGDKTVTGVRVKDNITKEINDISVTGFFVAIGHTPNSAVFKEYLNLDDNGYIITKPGSTYTNIPGVFAAGDVQDHIYRQAVTAAGSGCMAALDAERWLAAEGIH